MAFADVYVSHSGRAHPVSLTNALCPKFQLPPQYKATQLPFAPRGNRSDSGPATTPRGNVQNWSRRSLLSSCSSVEPLAPGNSPSGASSVDDGRLAHFLALCSKLAYEDLATIRDVVRSWGLHWEGATHGAGGGGQHKPVLW